MDEHPTTPSPNRPEPEWDSTGGYWPLERADSDERTASGSSAQDAAAEEAKHFDAAMRRMPADYQAVIELRHFEKKSLEEVGEALSRSTEAARQLWLHAFARLQEELGLLANQPRAQRPRDAESREIDPAPGGFCGFSRSTSISPFARGPFRREEGVALDANLREAVSPAKRCLELIDARPSVSAERDLRRVPSVACLRWSTTKRIAPKAISTALDGSRSSASWGGVAMGSCIWLATRP